MPLIVKIEFALKAPPSRVGLVKSNPAEPTAVAASAMLANVRQHTASTRNLFISTLLQGRTSANSVSRGAFFLKLSQSYRARWVWSTYGGSYRAVACAGQPRNSVCSDT